MFSVAEIRDISAPRVPAKLERGHYGAASPCNPHKYCFTTYRAEFKLTIREYLACPVEINSIESAPLQKTEFV